mgnify:CR=1 FL=1
MGLVSNGGLNVLNKDTESPTKKKKVLKADLSLTLRDVETLVILLQQVKVSVGQYPFKELNQVGETINKLGSIYEHLKDVEI